LRDEDPSQFENITLKPILLPGNAHGRLVFYNATSKLCIGADTLFQGSIGRTDLPGGDHDTLLDAIKTKLFALPQDVTVYPGHGPATTIGHEKVNNPFVGQRAGY